LGSSSAHLDGDEEIGAGFSFLCRGLALGLNFPPALAVAEVRIFQ